MAKILWDKVIKIIIDQHSDEASMDKHIANREPPLLVVFVEEEHERSVQQPQKTVINGALLEELCEA